MRNMGRSMKAKLVPVVVVQAPLEPASLRQQYRGHGSTEGSGSAEDGRRGSPYLA